MQPSRYTRRVNHGQSDTGRDPTHTEPKRMTVDRTGLLAASVAVVLWGVFPVYWKWLAHVDAVEVLMHRNVWCVVSLLGVVLVSLRRRSAVWTALRSGRQLALHALAGSLVGFNWGLYIWSVANDRVVEASLGYFIAPLCSVALGALVLGERLDRAQRFAVLLAALGVLTIGVGGRTVPWIGLGLGLSFASYGLLRKRAPTGPVAGLFLETLTLVPVSLAWLLHLAVRDLQHFGTGSLGTDALLVGGGLVTAVPLLLYGIGARGLPLSVLGLLFYITPSLQFLIGWLVYAEPISGAHWLGFGAIWLGLAVYSVATHRGLQPQGLSATGASSASEGMCSRSERV